MIRLDSNNCIPVLYGDSYISSLFLELCVIVWWVWAHLLVCVHRVQFWFCLSIPRELSISWWPVRMKDNNIFQAICYWWQNASFHIQLFMNCWLSNYCYSFSNLSIWWDGNKEPSCWRSEERNEVLTNLNQILSKPGLWDISKHGLYNFFTPLNYITEYLIRTGSLISMSPIIWYLPPHDHTLESKLKILPHNFRGLNSCSFGTMRLSKAS